jgi:GMP synthase-like glutamine amidotransferase
MPVLILKNVSSEGPGTIVGCLEQLGITYTIADLAAGEKIPAHEGFDSLVMLGGPMSVNDGISYIEKECLLARRFMDEGKPVFGVCLGAQIMAKALGSRVYPGPEKEIGWHDIELTHEALADERMKLLGAHPESGDVRRTISVFHWHGETFDIPEGAVHLASSTLYRNQAFRFGANAYAFQFHIEVTREMIYDWLKTEPIDQARLSSDTEQFYEVYQKRAHAFYESFFAPQNMNATAAGGEL